ncbi:MAG: hypothetical protein A2Y61_07705 [Chloroflexi bacterium RBG_13_60_13]|nr:MAG: hypothetical protein A2Y61_07705 [Chloroflexi bacterium RBG_13_60_13]
MYNRLSNDDVKSALDELIGCLGIKEKVPSDDLTCLLRKKDVEGCTQGIAARLGLPIRVNLSYVGKDFKPGDANRFRSSALAGTDSAGRGVASITAQVSVPQHLPMFGTRGLENYPIQVRVSENCDADPDTFVAIMAHELSHVLLSSLWSKHKDSDLHTDLVPIILGFGEVVRKGRKAIEHTTSGNITTTRTTTYGYLTDAQFGFACSYVAGLVEGYSHEKEHLLGLVGQVQGKAREALRTVAAFRDYFGYLDIHPPARMRKEDAERVVRLHGQDWAREWESRITAVGRSVKTAEEFGLRLNHYQSSAIEHLRTHIRTLEAASEEVDRITAAAEKDERMLRRYVSLIWRLRRKWHAKV